MAQFEQHPHSGRWHPLSQEIFRDVERSDRLLAADTREVGEKLVHRASLQLMVTALGYQPPEECYAR